MVETLAADVDLLRATLFERRPALAGAVKAWPLDAWVGSLDAADPALGYRHLPTPMLAQCDALGRELGADGLADYLHLLQAELIADFDRRFARSGLPECFRTEFEHNFARILAAPLRSDGRRRASITDDVFLKDLGIARLTLVPCVSHLMYRTSGVPRRAIMQAHGLPARLRLLRTVAFELGGFAPMIENHVHPAMLDRFSEEGRERCLRLVCALFDAWPDSRGLMGTSWYYDPALAAISPHLAYLHAVPAARGAHFFDMGASVAVRADATVRSRHRQELVAAGRYQPHAWMMLWPRKALRRHYGS